MINNIYVYSMYIYPTSKRTEEVHINITLLYFYQRLLHIYFTIMSNITKDMKNGSISSHHIYINFKTKKKKKKTF